MDGIWPEMYDGISVPAEEKRHYDWRRLLVTESHLASQVQQSWSIWLSCLKALREERGYGRFCRWFPQNQRHWKDVVDDEYDGGDGYDAVANDWRLSFG